MYVLCWAVSDPSDCSRELFLVSRLRHSISGICALSTDTNTGASSSESLIPFSAYCEWGNPRTRTHVRPDGVSKISPAALAISDAQWGPIDSPSSKTASISRIGMDTHRSILA